MIDAHKYPGDRGAVEGRANCQCNEVHSPARRHPPGSIHARREFYEMRWERPSGGQHTLKENAPDSDLHSFSLSSVGHCADHALIENVPFDLDYVEKIAADGSHGVIDCIRARTPPTYPRIATDCIPGFEEM